MRTVAAICLLLAACGPKTTVDPNKDPAKPKTDGSEKPTPPIGAGKDPGCLKPQCELGPSGLYSLCLESDNGQCFHYGGSCQPISKCRFSSVAKKYMNCESDSGASECAKWGDACEPNAKCLFDFDRNRFRTCTSFANGNCQQFSSLCAP